MGRCKSAVLIRKNDCFEHVLGGGGTFALGRCFGAIVAIKTEGFSCSMGRTKRAAKRPFIVAYRSMYEIILEISLAPII